MFTGIVEELGEVVERADLDRAARLTVRAPGIAARAQPGESIAVNGVCLTVVSGGGTEAFTVEVMAQTLARSTIGNLDRGAAVNLERAATLQTRLGGHLVQGHVDAVGTVLERAPTPHWDVVSIGLPEPLARYVVAQGSIAVDGISLTVTSVGPDSFRVSVIPTTRQVTTLGRVAPGVPVNLEVDIIAKYVERLLASRPEPVRDGEDR